MRNLSFDATMPKLTGTKMNDRGAIMLASAILLKAAEDYYYVCDHPLSSSTSAVERYLNKKDAPVPALKTRGMLELFIDSDFFKDISDIEPEHFKKTIKTMKMKKVPFPKNLCDAGAPYLKNGKEYQMQWHCRDGKVIRAGKNHSFSKINVHL